MTYIDLNISFLRNRSRAKESFEELVELLEIFKNVVTLLKIDEN